MSAKRLLYRNDRLGEHAPSWYLATADPPMRPRLEAHLEADVCIVGAGYTGLSAARELAERGRSIVVVDAHRVGWGASGRNGGQLGSGFARSQSSLEHRLGAARARQLWALSEEGKSMVREIAHDSADSVLDLEYVPGVISASHRARFVADAYREAERLAHHYDYPSLKCLDRHDIAELTGSRTYYGGVLDEGAGHLHPLRLALRLGQLAETAGARLFERSEALCIDRPTAESPCSGRYRVVTPQGSVRCTTVVLAGNGYLDRLGGSGARIMPINNFQIATAPLEQLGATILPGKQAVADSRFVVNYFRRTHDGRLLFGGGENYSYRFPADMLRRVRLAMLSIYPHLAGIGIDYCWGGTLAISRSRLPVLARTDRELFVVGGYSGHGLGLSLISGRVVAEAVEGDSTRFDWLAELPAAPFPGGELLRPALLAVAMRACSWRDRL